MDVAPRPPELTPTQSPAPARPKVLTRAAKWAGPALLLVEVILVLTGRLSLRAAAVVFVVLEVLLGLVAVSQLAGGTRRYRQQRAAGMDAEDAVRDALRAVLPRPVAAVVTHELLLWSSLVQLARRRRHGMAPGSAAIPYDAALRPMMLALVAVSVVELVVLELVIPWQPVRLVLAVLGVWGLLMVLGMTAANVVRPHVVSDDELRLRSGAWAQARIPLHAVATVAARRRHSEGGGALLVEGALVIGVCGGTDVDVHLHEPTRLTTSRGEVTVDVVRFAADDPAAAVRALRERVQARDPDSPG